MEPRKKILQILPWKIYQLKCNVPRIYYSLMINYTTKCVSFLEYCCKNMDLKGFFFRFALVVLRSYCLCDSCVCVCVSENTPKKCYQPEMTIINHQMPSVLIETLIVSFRFVVFLLLLLFAKLFASLYPGLSFNQPTRTIW